MKHHPKIGITLGDPNGIGPEVTIKALSLEEVAGCCRAAIYGSGDILKEAERLTGLKPDYDIVETGGFGKSDLNPGKNDAGAGRASLEYIESAVHAAMSGEVDAVVTAPISKEAIHLAGSPYPGHTEMLRDLTDSEEAVMMFDGGSFRVVLATIHCALSEVPGMITRQRVLSVIRTACSALKSRFGILSPRIAVCGLNPHAGEAGAFGREEIDSIGPAVEEARSEGMEVDGPLPADTLFYYANKGRWDAVVAMYHDQGLVPFKMLSFDKGVNVTIGLPIVRTSPDHGTAFDIAWQGKADPASMAEAIKLAARLAPSGE